MRKWLLALVLVAMLTPAWAGQPVVQYANRNSQLTIRAGVFVPPGLPGWEAAPHYGAMLATLTSGVVPVTYNAGGPGQFTFNFYPPKCPDYELINPLPIQDALLPLLDKTDPDYWRIPTGLGPLFAPLLSNYDFIVAPVYADWPLYPELQFALMRWVHQGGLLWLDYEPAPPPYQVNRLLLEPPPVSDTPTSDQAVKVAAQVTGLPYSLSSQLLAGRYALGPQEINLLGSQLSYATSALGASGTQRFLSGIDGQGSLPALLHEVVHTQSGVAAGPAIAAGRYGRGGIIASACGMARAIAGWQIAYADAANRELPEWSLPDIKFAYNVLQWWLSPAGAPLEAGSTREQIAPPLTRVSYQAVPDPNLVVPTPSGGAQQVAVWEGIAYFGDRDGHLYAMDTSTTADRDGDGSPDDGLRDWSTGASADLIWEYTLGHQEWTAGGFVPVSPDGYLVSGAPSLGTICDPSTGLPRTMIAFTAASRDGGQGYLNALWVDSLQPVSPYFPFPIQPHPSNSEVGKAGAGPLVADGMIFLVNQDSSGNFNAPARDSQLLVIDPLHPEQGVPPPLGYKVGAYVKLAQSGAVMSSAATPALGTVTVQDEVTGIPVEAETLVWAGNAMPRNANSATGRLWMTPALLRVVLPEWNGQWLQNVTGLDSLANQAVTISINGVPLPPHFGDVVTGTLNYVRRVSQNQAEIIFPRWSLFRLLPGLAVDYRTGWNAFQISYFDLNGDPRAVQAELSMGVGSPLNMQVKETVTGGPCVVGDTTYAAGISVNGYPGASFHGGLVAFEMASRGPAPIKWQFHGLRQAAATGAADRFYDFPVTPAVSGNLLFLAGNLAFTQEPGGSVVVPATGQQGVVYCLDTACGSELRLDESVAAGLRGSARIGDLAAIDYQAPVGASADPGGNAPPGQRGAPVFLALPNGEAVPPRTGSTNNWWVDYNNGIVHMGRQAVGRYYYDIANKGLFTYFSGGVKTAVPVYLPRLVLWQYEFPAGERVVSAPVASGSHVYLVTQDNANGQIWLHAFTAGPYVTSAIARDGAHAPVWTVALPTPTYLGANHQLDRPVSLTVANNHLLVSMDSLGQAGYVLNAAGHGQQGSYTLIADSNRLLGVDSEGRAAWAALATSMASPRVSAGPIPVLPEIDTYASRVNTGFARPSRVRQLDGGRVLVCDTGNNRVVELDEAGSVLWQYPDSDVANRDLYHSSTLTAQQTADLMAATGAPWRLLSPTDVQRYVAVSQETIGGNPHLVRWESTLIADAGNFRVLEVVRPLVDGVYDPSAGGADPTASYRQTVQVIAGEATTFGTGTNPIGKFMFTTACRLGTQADPIRTTTLLASAANHPADPGTGRPLGLLRVEITYDANGVVQTSRLAAGADGYSLLARRDGMPGDFLAIRQADTLSGAAAPQIMVVDRQGVKVVAVSAWPAPVAEMTATDYQNEMLALRTALAPYAPPAFPPCIREETAPDAARALDNAKAYAAADYSFHPVYAQYLADGRLLVVNGFGAPYGLSDPLNPDPAELAGPTKSEVLEYDPDPLNLKGVGNRIVNCNPGALWEHYLVPDPFSSVYPLVSGTSAGLKQPLAVERR